MIILGYVSDHKKDGLAARLGWALVRFVQRGSYQRVTHVEALLAGTDHRHVLIGSASLRDGGVRTKSTDLTPGHWIAIDVPIWAASRSEKWFAAHNGLNYDWRGAVGSVLFWLGQRSDQWFCNEAVAASLGLPDPERLTPSQFIALCMAMPNARDVTDQFFNQEAK